MHAVELSPLLKAPRRMRTLGDAIESFAFEWSQLPRELRNKEYQNMYFIRATAYAIGKILDEEWTDVPLPKLIDLDSKLVEYALRDGFELGYANRYACDNQKILAHARRRGWTGKVADLLNSWDPLTAALSGQSYGRLQIIKDLIARRRTPQQTREVDLEHWRTRAEADGLSASAADQYIARLRSRMRLAGLEDSFPLLDLKAKSPSGYSDSLDDMTEGALADLDVLIAFKTPGWVPGRNARVATRRPSVEKMVKGFRQVQGFAREVLKREPSANLRHLLAREIFGAWIEWLARERGLNRQAVRRTIAAILAIARQHPIFEGVDLGWTLALVKKIPKEPAYRMLGRKEEKTEPYEVLEQIPRKLRAKSEAPGVNPIDVAWLRHDAALISILLCLAFRQRNIRECGAFEPARVNVVYRKINLKMKSDLLLSDCVKAALSCNKNREFLMLEFDENETKAGRAVIEVPPLALAEVIQEYRDDHRSLLIQKGREHGKLFCNRRGGELSESSLRSLVFRLSREHIGKGITPHLWRDIHASYLVLLCATGMGGGMEQARYRLWHGAQETTETYTQLNYARPGIAALDRDFGFAA